MTTGVLLFLDTCELGVEIRAFLIKTIIVFVFKISFPKRRIVPSVNSLN